MILIMLLIGEMDFELSLLASCAAPLAMGVIMIWVIAKQLQETGKRVMSPDLWHYPFVFFAARSIWRGPCSGIWDDVTVVKVL